MVKMNLAYSAFYLSLRHCSIYWTSLLLFINVSEQDWKGTSILERIKLTYEHDEG